IPLFEQAAALCRRLGVWANVEIKPAKGHERVTGEVVARLARELWRGAAVQPLLSSFSVEALAAARAAVPELPRGYLVDGLPADWEAEAKRIKCFSVHCNQKKLTEAQAKAVRDAGYGL